MQLDNLEQNYCLLVEPHDAAWTLCFYGAVEDRIPEAPPAWIAFSMLLCVHL